MRSIKVFVERGRRVALVASLVLAAGLVLHAADGSFTPEAEAVLRAAAALEV